MGNPLEVLFLEDNEDDAELILLELQSSGFDVNWRRVETSDEFQAALQPTLDIILADYTLPQFNAPAALRVLKQANYDIPFIVVTGSISEEIAVACIKQGAADYLIKDRLFRLGEAIRQALEQQTLRQAKRKADRDLRIMDWAINSSINAVAMANLDGQITYVNQAFLKLWDYESEAVVLGQSILDLWQSESDAYSVVDAFLQRENAQGTMTMTRTDKVPLQLQFSTSTVLDEHQQPICIMAIFTDITERQKAEEVRREAEVLRVELEKEKQLLDLKSRFTSMVVHDFRNPLATMQLQLSMLQNYASRFTEEMRQDKIKLALEQIKQLNGMLEDVLAISKMESRKSSFHPIQVDVAEYCRQLFLDIEVSFGDKHHFKVEQNLNSLRMALDPNLIRRVLFNLVSNAVKYSPPESLIRLVVEYEDQAVVFKVVDEGIGIPEDDLEALFDTFHRASNVGKIEGTGLGLAIVKQAVELHGGTVSCESKINTGTTFIVRLPLQTVVEM